MKRTALLLGALVAAALMIGPTVTAGTTLRVRPAPKLANPTATGTVLSNRFFTLIVNKDIPGLTRFLSPAFQVQRADGSGSGKKEWLAKLADIQEFTLTDFHGTQAGGTLIVRYLATVKGTVNGRPYTPGPAPRLASYTWNGTRWQIVSNANFNPLTG
jgi:Domain of unknown function (DUF4440)